MKKESIQLTLWEVITLFDYLNTTYDPRTFQEPHRYHAMGFPHFYRFITGSDYEAKLREDRIRLEQKAKEEDLRRQFELEQERLIQEHQQRMAEQNPIMKASMDSAFDLAADLNPNAPANNKKKLDTHSDGIYSNKSYDQITEQDDESEEVVIKKDKTKKKLDKAAKKKSSQSKKKEMTFADKVQRTSDSEEDEESESEAKGGDALEKGLPTALKVVDENRPYRRVKHVFEIQVKELKNIPLLDKVIKDISSVENAKLQHSKQLHAMKKDQIKSKYIQNVAVKYSFPLDEDEMFQSDFLQLNNEALSETNQFDYRVSINTVHNYLMDKEDSISNMLKSSNAILAGQTSLFNISVVIYDSNKEFVIGNAQLPIEDILDIVNNYDAMPQQKQTLSRILFIYGTTYSQRENCIIGKMQMEINYHQERQYLPVVDGSDQPSVMLAEDVSTVNNPSCFLHRETFIKRKIPLNAVLSVEIERINNLKESIENIEHFAKVQTNAGKDDKVATNSNNNRASGYSATNMSKHPVVIQSREQTDRRRILTQIFKTGLNLVVLSSVFEEDSDLKKRFSSGRHTSRMLYNTLTPIFNEGFQIGIQMDTPIFEYLKSKKAVFEVRHYLLDSAGQKNQNQTQPSHNKSQSSVSHVSLNTDEQEERDTMHDNDYIVLGFVRVPLLHLITKNNGIYGDFVIFDDYRQQMGSLKLRISLNHHSHQRPLYSETTKLDQAGEDIATRSLLEHRGTMIDRTVRISQSLTRNSLQQAALQPQQYLLGLNFVELVLKNRASLLSGSEQNFMYLKFKMLGQTYQTKFLSNLSQSYQSGYLKQVGLTVFDIKKTVFVEIDFSLRQLREQSEFEEAFSKPLEIQLWLKKESHLRYQQAELEQHLGSFFIELNDLGKLKNKRIKEQNGLIQGYEGYFSLFDFQRQAVSPDRLACKVLIIKKEYETQLPDLETLFNNMSSLDSVLQGSLDPTSKGFVELDDLINEVERLQQGTMQELLKQYASMLEYKSSDKVFYSPLAGPVAPFFRYAKRFDSFGVVEKFNKEFQSIDTRASGFIPVNLFRSIMEHELKIKEKIVLDFINNLREVDQAQQVQSLDVNLFSHSLRSHIDYITLLRKMAFYFELNKTDVSEERRHALPVDNSERVTLTIELESGLRLKNPLNELEPPNAFLMLNIPYQGSQPQRIQTQTINRSSYPAWHLINQRVTFPFTQETLRHIIDYPLEIEVYHQTMGMRDHSSNIQIGVAYIDLSQMVFVDSVFKVSGYFHVVKKERFADGQLLTMTNPHRMSMESLGQIKLSITSTTNLKRTVQSQSITRNIARTHSPVNKNYPVDEALVQDQRFFQLNPYINAAYHSSTPDMRESATKMKLEESFTKTAIELEDKPESELKSALLGKMTELDQLHKSLLQKARERSSSPHQHFVQSSTNRVNFGETMHHGPNEGLLRQSFQPFSYQFQQRELQMTPTLMNHQHQRFFEAEAVREDQKEEEEDHESFRRDNIFENNISQSSNYQQEEADSAILRQIEEAAALNRELDQAAATLSYYDTFNQHHQPATPGLAASTTNVFNEQHLTSQSANQLLPEREVLGGNEGEQSEDEVRELKRVERILKQQRSTVQ